MRRALHYPKGQGGYATASPVLLGTVPVPGLGRRCVAHMSSPVSEMKYADSVVMVAVGSGILALGHLCRYVGLQAVSEVLLTFLAPLAPVIGATFALTDLRIPAWRRQAVMALVACGGLLALNLVMLRSMGYRLNVPF